MKKLKNRLRVAATLITILVFVLSAVPVAAFATEEAVPAEVPVVEVPVAEAVVPEPAPEPPPEPVVEPVQEPVVEPAPEPAPVDTQETVDAVVPDVPVEEQPPDAGTDAQTPDTQAGDSPATETAEEEPVAPVDETTDDVTPVPYTVTFWRGETQLGEAVSVLENGTLAEADAEALVELQEGQTLNGWFLSAADAADIDNESLVPYVFDTAVTGDFALYARILESSTQESDVPEDGTETEEEPEDETEEEPEDGTEEIKVTFMSDGEELLVSTVEGGLVADPGAPELPEGAVSFRGWFAAGETEPFDFAVGGIVEDLTLTAQFSNTYLVKYKNADDQVVYTEEIAPNGVAPQPSFPVVPPTGSFLAHWYVEGGDEATPYEWLTPVSSDITLVPYFSNQYLVFFISEGTQVDPIRVTSGDMAVEPEQPSREGYKFKWWTSNKETGAQFNFTSTPITKDTTLYAVWDGVKVGYTIALWLEVPNFGDGTPTPGNFGQYNFVQNFVIDKDNGAAAGTMTKIDDIKKLPRDAQTLFTSGDLKYANFQEADNRVLLGNGTTVINVFASRKVYTYRFPFDGKNGSMTIGDVTYSNSNTYQFSAKYEQDVELLWPSGDGTTFNFSGNTKYYAWGSTTDMQQVNVQGNTQLQSKRTVIDSSLLPKSGDNSKPLTFRLQTNTSGRQEFRYFAEVVPGQTAQITYKNVGYVEMTAYRQSLESNGSFAKAINGLNKAVNDGSPVPYRIDKQSEYIAVAKDDRNQSFDFKAFFYTRKAYDLTFNAMATGVTNMPDNEKGIKFQEPLVEYDPKADVPVRAGYTFDGWYKDSNYKEKFNFAKWTMPTSNMTAYAKWEPTALTVTFMDDMGANGKFLDTMGAAQDGNLDQQEVYDKFFTENEAVVGKGMFAGWYYVVQGRYVAFSYETPITKDLTLYANWKNSGFHVRYDLNGGGGTVPNDTDEYHVGKSARLAGSDGIEPPDGMVFINWKAEYVGEGAGKTYYPLSFFPVPGDTKMVAQYGAVDQYTKIIYDSNYPEGTDSEIPYAVRKNSTVTLAGEIFTYTNSQLLGWAEDENATEPKYALGYEGYPIKDAPVTLYAVWKFSGFTVSFVAGQGGTLSGEPATWETPGIPRDTAWSEADITMPEPVPENGYTFAGWKPEIPADDFAITENMLFTATFRELEIYTLTFKVEGGSFVGDPRTEYTATDVEKWDYTVPGLDEAKYVLERWVDEDGNDVNPASLKGTPATEDRTLTAVVHERAKYTLKFEVKGGEENPGSFAESDTEFDAIEGGNWDYSVPGLDESNAIFDHWELDGVEIDDPASLNGEAADANHVITAVFRDKEEFTLDFVVRGDVGGSLNGDTEFTAIERDEWDYTAPEAEAEDGHYFVGWYLVGEEVTTALNADASDFDGQIAEKDIEIEAVFAQTTGITVVGVSEMVTYNGTLQSVTGATVEGDLLDGHAVVINGESADAIVAEGTNVGEYAMGISAETVSIVDEDGNDVTEQYTLTLVDGGLTIAKAALTIQIRKDIPVAYGEDAPELSDEWDYATGAGPVASEEATVLAELAAEAPTWNDFATEYAAGSDVGRYDVTSSATGDIGLENYTVSVLPGNLLVTREIIVGKDPGTDPIPGEGDTVDAYLKDNSKEYGQQDPAPLSAVVFANGLDPEHFTVSEVSRVTGEDVLAGGYAMSATLTAKPEYEEYYTVNGELAATFTITPAALTLTAPSDSIYYAQYAAEVDYLTALYGKASYDVQGLVNNGVVQDTIASLRLPDCTFDTSYDFDAPGNIGKYDIDFVNEAPELQNYEVTLEAGTLTVALLTVNLDDEPGEEDDDPTDGDISVYLNVADASKFYARQDAGDYGFEGPAGLPKFLQDNFDRLFNYDFNRVAGENVQDGAPYAINATLTSASDNIAVKGTPAPGAFTIKPLPVHIVPQASGKAYGESDPNLLLANETWGEHGKPESWGDFSFDTLNYTVVRVDGEEVGGYDLSITDYEDRNPNYLITVGTLNGDDEGGGFQITPAGVLFINVSGGEKIYGEDDPAFTVTLSGDVREGVTAEDLGVKVTRKAGEDVGTYSLGVEWDENSALAATYEEIGLANVGSLVINPRPITLVANSYSIDEGDAIPEFKGYVSGTAGMGLAKWDTELVYSLYRENTATTPGEYEIQFNMGANLNYAVTVVPGTLIINAVVAPPPPDDSSSSEPSSDPDDSSSDPSSDPDDSSSDPSSSGSGDPSSSSTTPGGGTSDPSSSTPADPGTGPAGPVAADPGVPVVPAPPVAAIVAPPVVVAAETPVVAPAGAPAPVATVPDETPEDEAPVIIPEDVAPLATAPTQFNASWALLNLLVAILTLVFAVLLFVTMFKRNKKRDETAEEQETRMLWQANRGEEPDEYVRNKKSGLVWRVISILAGIVAPIVFLLTEDMRNPMIFTDRWTLLMILILVVQVLGMVLLRQARNKEEDPQSEEAGV